MEFHLAKQGNKFIPADTESQIKALKIGQGEVIRCKSISQRNYRFHKKFFALIQLAWENLPEKYDGYFPTSEHLRRELLIVSGFFVESKDFYGNVKKEAQSISFGKMGQEEFEQVYNRVLDVVCRLIGVDDSEIMAELMEFM